MFDVVLRHGLIVNGTGEKAYAGDLAVRDGKIAEIGTNLGNSHADIDASGLVIAPGFIDTHSHSDIMALHEPELLPKLMQGITSELLGQDGIGPAPIPHDAATRLSWRGYLAGLDGNPPIEWNWSSLDEYITQLGSKLTGCNLLPLLPFGNVRMCVKGLKDELSCEEDLLAMEKEVDKAMAAGAWGISLGMVYMPCTFASNEEYVRIFKRVGQQGGFLVVHMRNGSSLLLESIDELFAICEAANIPLHISHFKAAGKANWHKMSEALKSLEAYQNKGHDVSFDIYPYTAGSTMFSILLPPWAVEGGMEATLARLKDSEIRKKIVLEWTSPKKPTMKSKGWDNPVYLNGWDNIFISSARSGNPEIVGKRFSDIAEKRGISPEELLFQLMEEEHGDMGVLYFSMSEDNVAEGICHRYGNICTDGLLGGTPHPRVYGSFPRVLGHYVRELKKLSLEEAVHKMTGKPASRLGLKDRGLLLPGRAADIVVFSQEEICDTATYENPRQYPLGIRHVFVNGIHSVKDGRFTGKLGGKTLRKNAE